MIETHRQSVGGIVICVFKANLKFVMFMPLFRAQLGFKWRGYYQAVRPSPCDGAIPSAPWGAPGVVGKAPYMADSSVVIQLHPFALGA
jgi:hypothetical protein